MFFVPIIPLRIQKLRICQNTWWWPATGRGLVGKSEVWRTQLSLRLVGPHRQTKPSSARVTVTLKVEFPHQMMCYLNVLVEQTNKDTLKHHVNVNHMQVNKKNFKVVTACTEWTFWILGFTFIARLLKDSYRHHDSRRRWAEYPRGLSLLQRGDGGAVLCWVVWVWTLVAYNNWCLTWLSWKGKNTITAEITIKSCT